MFPVSDGSDSRMSINTEYPTLPFDSKDGLIWLAACFDFWHAHYQSCSPFFPDHFLMILSSHWAYLKEASKMQAYQDIKAKEEQELQDIQSRSKEQLNSYT